MSDALADPAGHVFIVHGDLTRVACDAWLMPCGIDARPNPFWWTDVERSPRFVWRRPPIDWDYRARRCYKLYASRHIDAEGVWRPTPWLVNVGGGSSVGVGWYLEGVREFFTRVAADPDLDDPLNGRARPLVALPIVGTGYGGMRHRAGEVVGALLPCLYEAAAEFGFDIALVVKDGADYAAAQRARLSFHEEGVHRWPSLGAPLRERGDQLALRASQGELVVFLGSGVSVGAGLPTWGAFLRALSDAPEQTVRIDWDQLERWSYADQARIIERGFGDKAVMARAIARMLRRTHYSLTHAFTAALPSRQIVTTNYDTLFEQASEAIGEPVAALPYDKVSPRSRWILKLHGCVDHPEDIVVTREDYMRYSEQRRALAGTVQSLLLTRHMLFVGFSLDDDNFHRIADDVRKIVVESGGDTGEPFGSSIVLHDRPFLEDMWRDEVDMVAVGEDHHSTAEAARRVEIFLDYVLAHTVDPRYLLNERFSHILSEPERQLRDELLSMLRRVDGSVWRTPAWSKIANALVELGWDGRFT